MDLFKQFSRIGVTVIFTHHHRKKTFGDKGDGAESSRGSSAINAAISGHLSLDEEIRDNGTFLILRHLKSKAGEKIHPIEVKIVKENGKVDFHYEGMFKDQEKIILTAKDAIMDFIKVGEWKSTSDLIGLGVSSKNNTREACNQLVKEKRLKVLTRGEARAKGIPLSTEGKSAKENIYSLEEKDFSDFDDVIQSAITNL